MILGKHPKPLTYRIFGKIFFGKTLFVFHEDENERLVNRYRCEMLNLMFYAEN